MIEITRTPIGFLVNAYTNDKREEIELDISRIIERDEHIYGLVRVSVKSFVTGVKTKLYFGNLNLTSSRARKELAESLKELWGEINWRETVEAILQKIVEAYYTPEQPTRARIVENTGITYLIEPLLVKGHPILIYAAGGTGKSLLAQYLSMLCENGRTLYNKEGAEKKEVLYLDWELDELEFSRRISMLTANFGDIETDLRLPLYKRCMLTLQDELNSIIRLVTEHDVQLVVIDSAGPACGGDINDASRIIQFFNAIRKLTSLNTTVLILSHVSKNSKKLEDEKTPIGSIYFENLSRVTWELKQQKGEDSYLYALFCRKSNFGPLRAVGFEVVFAEGFVFFKAVDSEEVEDLSIGKMTAKDLIISALEMREMSAAEIARETGIDKQTVWVVLNRLKGKGIVTNKNGTWFLTKKEGVSGGC